MIVTASALPNVPLLPPQRGRGGRTGRRCSHRALRPAAARGGRHRRPGGSPRRVSAAAPARSREPGGSGAELPVRNRQPPQRHGRRAAEQEPCRSPSPLRPRGCPARSASSPSCCRRGGAGKEQEPGARRAGDS